DRSLARTSLFALEVLYQLDRIIPCPTRRCEQVVQSVGVRSRVRVGQHLPTQLRPIPAADLASVRHSPLDLGHVKRLFERCHYFSYSLLSEQQSGSCSPRLSISRRHRDRRRSIHYGVFLHLISFVDYSNWH